MNNKYLLDLQEEWLEQRDSTPLYEELFSAINEMAQIQIKHICSQRGLSFLPDKIDALALDACLEIMDRYKNKPEWRVKSNYINVIRLSCIKYMFDNRFRDKLKIVQYDEESPMESLGESEEDKFLERESLLQYKEELMDFVHYPQLVEDAKHIKKFPLYLKHIAKYCSLNWLKINITYVKLLWEEYSGNEKDTGLLYY